MASISSCGCPQTVFRNASSLSSGHRTQLPAKKTSTRSFLGGPTASIGTKCGCRKSLLRGFRVLSQATRCCTHRSHGVPEHRTFFAWQRSQAPRLRTSFSLPSVTRKPGIGKTASQSVLGVGFTLQSLLVPTYSRLKVGVS